MKVLVVEDEPKVSRALEEALSSDGYQVMTALQGDHAIALVASQTFDMVLLDIMLPGADGFEVLSAIRRSEARTHVILLTARDSVTDRVRGLDSGADDYVVKPFAVPELLARVRAHFRRGQSVPEVRLRAGDIDIDLLGRSVTRGHASLDLTAREFALLEYLVRHAGRPVSREMLARDVWNESQRAPSLDNVIDVHIARLRRKVDDPFEHKMIRTVRGLGFLIEVPARS